MSRTWEKFRKERTYEKKKTARKRIVLKPREISLSLNTRECGLTFHFNRARVNFLHDSILFASRRFFQSIVDPSMLRAVDTHEKTIRRYPSSHGTEYLQFTFAI